MQQQNPPSMAALLESDLRNDQPIAVVLAGHNGSGKSTLWYGTLADSFKIPLVNADRLTLSILPEPDGKHRLKPWAARLRDEDERWQKLSQKSVQLFMGLIMDQGMSFAFETVFSYLEDLKDGTYRSKIDTIVALQKHGYFVILLFVGLANSDLSIGRVKTRIEQGGHAVPEDKLRSRYPKTQKAIGMASRIADMTLMFDNSRGIEQAFSLVRAQKKSKVLYDCRDQQFRQDQELLSVASLWLSKVAPE